MVGVSGHPGEGKKHQFFPMREKSDDFFPHGEKMMFFARFFIRIVALAPKP
jgi:hypothetical protein